jgi:putative DNA primase/helicase
MNARNSQAYSGHGVKQFSVHVGAGGAPLVIDLKNPLQTMTVFADLHFCHGYGQRTLHCHNKKFFDWTGAFYREQPDQVLRDLLYEFLSRCRYRAQVKGSTDWEEVSVKPNKRMVDEHLDALRTACAMDNDWLPPCWLDQNSHPTVVACRNGLVDVATGDLFDPSPGYFNLNACAFDYDPKAQCPEWHRFLESLWPDDPEAISSLQEIFGYLLSGETRQQKAFLWVGPPRSGRGTILRMLDLLVPCVPTSFASLGENFGAENLIGASVAIMGDEHTSHRHSRPEQPALAINRFLRTTGEDIIDVPRKNLPVWQGRLRCRFVICSNVIITLADAGEAFSTRFLLHVFAKSWLGCEDTGLGDRLRLEAPGVFAWALEGNRQRLARGGQLVEPRSAANVAMKFRPLIGAVAAFVKDRCRPGGTVLKSELLIGWELWCNAVGREAGLPDAFWKELHKVVPQLTEYRPAGADDKRPRWFMGLSLRGLDEG